MYTIGVPTSFSNYKVFPVENYIMFKLFFFSCVELANALDLSLPLGEKSKTEINAVFKEYDKNIEIFKATCVTQLKIIFFLALPHNDQIMLFL